MRKNTLLKKTLRILSAAALVIVLDACASRIDSRGNLLDPDRLAELKIGTHSRDQVSEILGSPSSTAIFDKETWYYISKRTETIAFFEPTLKKQQVIVVEFDDKGVLSAVNKLGMEEARIVHPVQRKTPTSGNELGVIDHIKGNLKRFKKRGRN